MTDKELERIGNEVFGEPLYSTEREGIFKTESGEKVKGVYTEEGRLFGLTRIEGWMKDE